MPRWNRASRRAAGSSVTSQNGGSDRGITIKAAGITGSTSDQYPREYKMAENITDPLDIIYTPQQIVTIGTSYLYERRKNKGAGIPLGLASIDKDFLPALPGELITVIGRPGNGKTGFMMRWARWRAEQLHLQGIEDRVV